MSDCVAENRLEQKQPETGNPQDNFNRGELYQGVANLNGAESTVPGNVSNQASDAGIGQGAGGHLDFGTGQDLYGSGHYNVTSEHVGSNLAQAGDPGLGSVSNQEASAAYNVPSEHRGSGSSSVSGSDSGPEQHLDRTESDNIKSQGLEGSISGSALSNDSASNAMDSGANTPRDRNFAMWSGTFAPENAAAAAPERQDFNPTTDKLDGHQFYELSNNDMANLPISTLENINSNNVSNLAGRVEALGERMPDVAFRGVSGRGAEHMEKLMSDDSKLDYRSLHLAVTKHPSQDPQQQLGDMAANLRKAGNYSTGGDGAVYAFDVSGSDKSKAFRKDHARSAPAPFAPSPNTGEQILPIDKDLKHITTLSGKNLNVEQIPTNSPDYMERTKEGGVLDVNHTAQQLNKVLNSIEAPHREQLEAQRKQMQESRRQTESEMQNASIFNRLANTVKSWF